MDINKKKMIILFSGGIDSSSVLFLIKLNMFYVECVFIKNWNSFSNNFCESKIDLIYVKKICKEMNIKIHLIDYTKTYWNQVFLIFLKELKNGLTPNPDILCNKEIKFKIFLNYSQFFLKFDFLITGHYSCVSLIKNRFEIHKCFDIKKDQSYFLYRIKKNIRKKIIFPLTNFSKNRLKNIIKFIKLLNVNKKSSSGICFIGEKKFDTFIKKYLKIHIGQIITDNNLIIGNHSGLFFYTIGQRLNFFSEKKISYVFKKDYKKNILYITHNKSLLFVNKIVITKINFKFYKKNGIFYFKIRHSIYKAIALLSWNSKLKKHIVTFKNIQLGIAPGQSIVFYNEDYCIGGGIIDYALFI